VAQLVHEGRHVVFGPMTQLGGAGTPWRGDLNWLQVEKLAPITPLDAQVGVNSKKSVPDALHDALFGQPDPTEAERAVLGAEIPPLATFAVLDAGKTPYLLTSLLESSGLRYQSLFQNKAQEELGEHAPFLVELKDSNDFTRRLFTRQEGAGGLWEKELGIFIRSRAGFDALRKHLRKFTRVQDEEGNWFYFRFWDSVTRWDVTRQPLWISQFCAHPVSSAVVMAQTSAYRISQRPNAQIRGCAPVLTPDLKMHIALVQKAQFAQDTLRNDHRDLHRTLTPDLRDEWSWRMAQAFHAYDLRRSWSQDCYISLALILGSQFDTDLTYQGVQEILKQNRPCYARMLNLREECFRIIRDVCGQSYQNYALALNRFAMLDAPQVARIMASENPLGVILDFFPERARLLSMDRQKLLTDRCNAKAQAAFAPEDQRGGAVLLFAHAFLLGEGSLEDPLHDYLRSILRSDHPDKVQRLLRYGQKRARAQLRLIRKTQG